ncbi:mite allergen Der p 3-like [Culicoides brevitarsis]|uniref:mite allergen Der p 3-like n=1 Tax=Culicoides brevitarsis TaxID=469753 RepID=UPI00307BE2F4
MLRFLFLAFLVNFSHGLLSPSRKALPGEAPFMVRISDGRQFCGGTLIRDNIVLTAGHCARASQAGFVSVTAGTNYVNSPGKGQKHYAEQLLPHANFSVGANGVQAYNDIALIKLSTPFELNSDVQPISWANVSLERDSVMFGFGYNDFHMPAQYLRAINVTFIEEPKCVEMLAKTITKSVKENYELCAEKCACNGDSGSPLIQKDENGEAKIVGIASWLADDLYGCTTPPAVFLKVAEFEDWITEKLKDLEISNKISTESSEKKSYRTTRHLARYF